MDRRMRQSLDRWLTTPPEEFEEEPEETMTPSEQAFHLDECSRCGGSHHWSECPRLDAGEEEPNER